MGVPTRKSTYREYLGQKLDWEGGNGRRSKRVGGEAHDCCKERSSEIEAALNIKHGRSAYRAEQKERYCDDDEEINGTYPERDHNYRFLLFSGATISMEAATHLAYVGMNETIGSDRRLANCSDSKI